MFVYWGSNDSGKSHLKNYAKLNNKTNLLWLNHEIRKIKTQTHIDEITWREETIHRIIYHNLDNELRKCDKKERRIWRHAEHIHRDSSINPDKIQYGPRNPLVKKKKGYTKDHIKKYTQKEFVNTTVYFDMILSYGGGWGDGICKPLTHDVLKDHYEEILEDVDVLSFLLPEWAIDALEDKLRKSVNIIPYKSNHLDSVISKLDGFKNFRVTEWGNDILEVYKQDKNRIWRWIDSFQEEMDDIKKNLTRRNIPYQMFNLDEDSYADTFGWEKEISRKFSHRGESWKCDNYKNIEAIAKEYISIRSL
tara:strand:- start:272 stop:1189 length:918 start_codon:yes stop_codon:yes gene_type:complete